MKPDSHGYPVRGGIGRATEWRRTWRANRLFRRNNAESKGKSDYLVRFINDRLLGSAFMGSRRKGSGSDGYTDFKQRFGRVGERKVEPILQQTRR